LFKRYCVIRYHVFSPFFVFRVLKIGIIVNFGTGLFLENSKNTDRQTTFF
jgi:hypothetical protein